MNSRSKRLTLTGSRTCGAVPGSFDDHELASGLLGQRFTTSHRGDRVPVAVDHEHRAANPVG